MSKELWRRSAGKLASQIAQKKISSREVIEAHLARIDDVNPTINAMPTVLRDEALAAADEADRAVRKKARLGPLHGVPFSIKTNIDLVGQPTTNAVPLLAHAILSPNEHGGYTVSVRAPLARPAGADALCRAFATGGGRTSAAGIDDLPHDALTDFVQRMERAFR